MASRADTERTSIATRLHRARMAAFLGADSSDPGGPVGEKGDDLDALLARTADIFQHSISDDTRRHYARRWAAFESWCTEADLAPLPAAPETVMLYLAETLGAGSALNTLRGWMAAINRVHIEAGVTAPGTDPAMSLFLRGLSRMAPGSRKVNVSALRIAALRQVCVMLDQARTSAAQVRDRVVLVLHRGGLTDPEISHLKWEDIRVGEHQIRVWVSAPPHANKRGRWVTLRERTDTTQCPLAAVRAWADLTGVTAGPVFVGVEPARAQAPALTPKSIFLIRKSRIESLGQWGGIDTAIALLGAGPPDVIRDKAAILLGFAGAFRRVDLVRGFWRHLKFVDQGAVLHLPKSKTDRHGVGRDVGIPRGTSTVTCPVTALLQWRSWSQAAHGDEPIDDFPIFVHVGRSGRLGRDPLSPEAMTMLVKRRTEQAGLDGKWGGRSLRAGFISTAADLNIPLEQIARQSRHADLDTLMLYIRSENAFHRNPAAQVGL